MSEQSPVFGIDLGTTYSCIAYVDENNRPTVVPNSGGSRTTPSVVQFADAEIVVGDEAKNSSALHPDYTISSIKREMGKNVFRFEYEEKKYSPEEISSFILRKLVQDAEQFTGIKIQDVVISCPAYFGSPERDATAKAGEIAGLNVLNIINEPTAAAIAYGINEQTDQTVLVYDLGGGTFDVTIINIESGNIIVVCTDGNHELGGKNWDDSLLRYFNEEWCRQNSSSEDPFDSLETLNDWSLEAEKAKKTLTGRNKTEFNLIHNGQKARISLTREKFDELTENLLNLTIQLTQQAIAEAKKRKATQIDKILLVGGSTRMPQVASRLEKEFGTKPEFSDPDESVAKGAAVYGFKLRLGEKIIETIASQSGQKPEDIVLETIPTDILDKAQEEVAVEFNLPPSTVKEAIEKTITDVTSRTFGIVTYSKGKLIVKNLIIVNDPVPAKKTETFGTFEDNQTSVELTIVDNFSSDLEYDLPPASREIQKAELTIPPNLPKGTPIEITYDLNKQGRLNIHAKELVGGNEIHIDIETEIGASKEEIEEAKSRSKNLVIS